MPDIGNRRIFSPTTSSSSSLPYHKQIEDLGLFNEESCRYFLREVGTRVVPFYPFNFGMEEVYSLILEKYGYAGLPDVTSVLQDLLESEGDAGGMGDDGDIWRSWRHSWRHRNDDTRNPFVPKVGNFVLQPPTQGHIRRLKTQNFVHKVERLNSLHEKRAPLAPVSGNSAIPNRSATPEGKSETLSDEEDYVLPATTYSHQRCRALLASEGGSPSSKFVGGGPINLARQSYITEESSQQEFVEEHDSPKETSIDPALLLAFQMLNGNQSSSEQPSLRGGQGDMCRLQQVETLPASPCRTEEEPVTVDQQLLPASTYTAEEDPVTMDKEPLPASTYTAEEKPATVDKEMLPALSYTPEEEPVTVDRDSSAQSNQRQEMVNEQTSPRTTIIRDPVTLDSLEEKTKSTEAGPREPNDNRPCARVISNSGEPSKLRRAKNREARLIDGNIILPVHQKRLSSQRYSPPKNMNISAAATADVDETKAQVARRSWTSSRQNSPRHSWLQSVRTVFRSGSQGKDAKSPPREAPPTSPKEQGPSKGAQAQAETQAQAQDPAAGGKGEDPNPDPNPNSQSEHSLVAPAPPPHPPLPLPPFSHRQALDGTIDSKYWARKRYSLPLRTCSLTRRQCAAN
ncbi:hypothetical protein LTR47_006018 [Exophiala xenobiotica]|nr:hypothetical protein LTR47_006018 [Exophiala xenobiotica]KAK5255471.1 hypothetical protein LTS06_000492 [Exophiala xenobiotica]KAK5348697.1 hypothetical protein LTR61_007724 [Exophiala xenobiotica]KAK5366939.1 hypothetical protein LTR11_008107 [Exophiala xenobiotica]KAK5367993.1 hypothetical protein LTS03_008137 [Exophiala xenobiotica]